MKFGFGSDFLSVSCNLGGTAEGDPAKRKRIGEESFSVGVRGARGKRGNRLGPTKSRLESNDAECQISIAELSFAGNEAS